MNFVVQISETLQLQVEVVADNEDEAIRVARTKYRNGEIVLDSSDHVETSFGVCR